MSFVKGMFMIGRIGLLAAASVVFCIIAEGRAHEPAPALPKATPLTEREQNELLTRRVLSGPAETFAQFSNMFMASSRQQLKRGIALVSRSPRIVNSELISPFPAFYRPKLRELFDTIAWQSHARWEYDSTEKFIDREGDEPPTDTVLFEFIDHRRPKPYAVTLPKGWKSEDMGNWTMYIPPSAPVGLDIYEMGMYSADEPAAELQLLARVPLEVSLEWANRVKEGVQQDEFQLTKVGPHEAIYFDAIVPTHDGKEAHWRQWVFMGGHTCYFLVSTIMPNDEGTIFPDVEAMLKSFRLKSDEEWRKESEQILAQEAAERKAEIEAARKKARELENRGLDHPPADAKPKPAGSVETGAVRRSTG